jgi:hypothetical protein
MMKIIALALASAAALSPVAVSTASAAVESPFYPTGRVDQMRAGRFVVTVFEGQPPGTSNARNSVSRGVRVFELPRRSTFAAVAAQELFELDSKLRWGPQNKARMEIISHEIESLVASRYGGFDLASFEAKEARALSRYPALSGMPEGMILAEMRRARPAAEAWLAANRDVVRALVAYRFPR